MWRGEAGPGMAWVEEGVEGVKGSGSASSPMPTCSIALSDKIRDKVHKEETRNMEGGQEDKCYLINHSEDRSEPSKAHSGKSTQREPL